MSPIVVTAKVKKTLLGKVKIQFECPHCQNALTSLREEVGVVDDCPICGDYFIIHPDVLKEIEGNEAAIPASTEPQGDRSQHRVSGVSEARGGSVALALKWCFGTVLWMALWASIFYGACVGGYGFVAVTKWLAYRASPSSFDEGLAKQHKEIDSRASATIARQITEFTGPKDACYRCRTRPATRNVSYHFKDLGYCSTCEPFPSTSKHARTPLTEQYEFYLRNKSDIESDIRNRAAAEKSALDQRHLGGGGGWFFGGALIAWVLVGGLIGLLVVFNVFRLFLQSIDFKFLNGRFRKLLNYVYE